MQAVQTAMAIGSGALQWASDDLKNDREIVLAAIKHDSSEILHASDDLKKDNKIILTALTYNTKQRFDDVNGRILLRRT